MSATFVFDTLQYANKLKSAGVPTQQAEIQAEALAEIIEDKLATKQDLKALELNLTLKMAELKAELIKWGLGIAVAQSAIIISCLRLFH